MKIDNVVICDFIRTENTGKHIIVGAYQNNIQFQHFPVIIGLSVWLQATFPKSDEYFIEYRVKKDRKILSVGNGQLEILPGNKSVTIPIPPIKLEIEDKGMLVFQIREKNKRWITMKKLPIEAMAD